jgi:hypothetical protein
MGVSFQKCFGGLGCWGHNISEVRDGGISPSKYNGWTSDLPKIKRSKMEITCRYNLHLLIIDDPLLSYFEIAKSIIDYVPLLVEEMAMKKQRDEEEVVEDNQ